MSPLVSGLIRVIRRLKPEHVKLVMEHLKRATGRAFTSATDMVNWVKAATPAELFMLSLALAEIGGEIYDTVIELVSDDESLPSGAVAEIQNVAGGNGGSQSLVTTSPVGGIRDVPPVSTHPYTEEQLRRLSFLVRWGEAVGFPNVEEAPSLLREFMTLTPADVRLIRRLQNL
jgi:hypothetical protein